MSYKVLVVDDQALPRQLFANIIENSEDFTLVASIDSAKMADLYLAKESIDLILMDVVMQDEVNGLDMTEKIKKTYPKVKIVIVTSMPDASFLEKAKKAGADSFWYKEIQEVAMLDLMRQTMLGEHIYPDQAPVVSFGLTESNKLTARELEVLRYLVSGLTDKEIAEQLNMSYHTARFHMNQLLEKTGCSTRTMLAIQAVQKGIIVPEV